MAPFEDRDRIEASAWLVGDRIEVRGVAGADPLAHHGIVVGAGAHGLAMVFRYGAVVLFEVSDDERAAFLEGLGARIVGLFASPEGDEAEIQLDRVGEEGVDAQGCVHLRDAGVDRLQVVAEVLARSAVLAHYDERVAEVLDRVEPLAAQLREGRAVRIPARRILRELGGVLSTEARMVGRSEVADRPDLTWDRPDLDRLWARLCDEYELLDRDRVLARKLDLVSRTTGTLLELLQNRRSLRVEWYIVVLIAVEIVLIVYDIFR